MNKSPSESKSFITEVPCNFNFTDIHMRKNYHLNRALDRKRPSGLASFCVGLENNVSIRNLYILVISQNEICFLGTTTKCLKPLPLTTEDSKFKEYFYLKSVYFIDPSSFKNL